MGWWVGAGEGLDNGAELGAADGMEQTLGAVDGDLGSPIRIILQARLGNDIAD